MRNTELNNQTQPHIPLPVFNNWDVVAKAWYFAFKSSELKKGESKKLQIATQYLVVFRGQDGVVRAVDGFCPHMGTDLALGKVQGNDLRCVFHHWKFNGAGQCVDVPCLREAGIDETPKNLKFKAYAATERHGAIWIYPDLENPAPFPEFEQYKGVETVATIGMQYTRGCHPHVPMINGIDPQHLRTIHGLTIDMSIEVAQNGDGLIYELKGQVPTATFKERLARKLFGSTYGYSVAYSGGTVGLLTTLKYARLFGRGRELPSLTMMFAYRPTADFKTLVTPIYITKKRDSLMGRIVSRILLTTIKYSSLALRDEDGAIYENIRFNPHALLPIDKPLAKFIAYVNRLTPSVWSKTPASLAPSERRVREKLEEDASNGSLTV